MTKLHIKQKAGRMQVFAKDNYPVPYVNRKLTPMTTVFSSILKAIGTPLGVVNHNYSFAEAFGNS